MHCVVFKTRMILVGQLDGDPSAVTDLIYMENRNLSVESEDILSSELTSSDSEACTYELNNTH